MALDEIVLTARSQGVVPNTLRFLQFSPACTLVGYHQAVEQEIRLSYCRTLLGRERIGVGDHRFPG